MTSQRKIVDRYGRWHVRRWLSTCLAGLLASGLLIGSALAAEDQEKKPEAPSIPGLGPTGPVTTVHQTMKFAEGPAAAPDGTLYFTDVPMQQILIARPGGKAELYMDKSQGANGLMFYGPDLLLVCQGGFRHVVAIEVSTKKVEILAETYAEQRLNGPNDLVLDRDGGIYFTDPNFVGGLSQKSRVFYLSPKRELVMLNDTLKLPNGIILSPDEKTLYVLQYGHADVMAFPVEEPGKIGAGRVLYQLEQPKGQMNRGGDGMTVDVQGNLYLTAPAIGAVVVIDAQGKQLGKIQLKLPPSNCTFAGPDFKTLYITARSALYAAPMAVAGHQFGPAR